MIVTAAPSDSSHCAWKGTEELMTHQVDLSVLQRLRLHTDRGLIRFAALNGTEELGIAPSSSALHAFVN